MCCMRLGFLDISAQSDVYGAGFPLHYRLGLRLARIAPADSGFSLHDSSVTEWNNATIGNTWIANGGIVMAGCSGASSELAMPAQGPDYQTTKGIQEQSPNFTNATSPIQTLLAQLRVQFGIFEAISRARTKVLAILRQQHLVVQTTDANLFLFGWAEPVIISPMIHWEDYGDTI